jgi:hypothetical protein
VNKPTQPRRQTPTPDDESLQIRLGELLHAVDPPPADMLELARRSFALRTLDAELASLVEDSTSEAAAPSRAVSVRADAAAEPRQLTFHFDDRRRGDELVIAIQVESFGGRRRLTGHLAPPDVSAIEVRQPAVPQVRAVDVDRLGRFVVDDLPAGPTKLTCRRRGVSDVATEWTLL